MEELQQPLETLRQTGEYSPLLAVLVAFIFLLIIVIVVLYREGQSKSKFNQRLSEDTLKTLTEVTVLMNAMTSAYEKSESRISDKIVEQANTIKSHISQEVTNIRLYNEKNK